MGQIASTASSTRGAEAAAIREASGSTRHSFRIMLPSGRQTWPSRFTSTSRYRRTSGVPTFASDSSMLRRCCPITAIAPGGAPGASQVLAGGRNGDCVGKAKPVLSPPSSLRRQSRRPSTRATSLIRSGVPLLSTMRRSAETASPLAPSQENTAGSARRTPKASSPRIAWASRSARRIRASGGSDALMAVVATQSWASAWPDRIAAASTALSDAASCACSGLRICSSQNLRGSRESVGDSGSLSMPALRRLAAIAGLAGVSRLRAKPSSLRPAADSSRAACRLHRRSGNEYG